MRAVVTTGDRTVRVEDRPTPTPGTGEVLVRVHAAGLNSADRLQAAGLYPPPPGAPPDIPGLELAGEVAAVGDDATRFEEGDRVMAVVAGGGHAEYCVVHERCCLAVPSGMDWVNAGGFPEVFTTAHDSLFTQGGLSMGERLLVHGAAGGVGTAAVQLAVAAGARVTATIRSEANRPAVAEFGAEAITQEGFEETGPYDQILELVGAPNLAGDIKALGAEGRLCIIGIGAGAKGEVNLRDLMGKRIRVFASTLRARPLEQKAEAARRMERHVLPLVGTKLRVPVAEVFPLDQAAEAYEFFAQPGKFGKVVLSTE